MKFKIDGKLQDFDSTKDYRAAIRYSKTQYNAYLPWTLEDDMELLRLLETDMTYKEIAIHFKRTPGAIGSRKAKLKLTSQVSTEL